MDLSLEGRVAIVTGSTQKVGKSIAMLLAEAGAKVVVNGRNAEAGNAIAQEIKAKGGTAIFQQADIYDYGQVEKMVKATVNRFGQVDILVANGAAITNVTLPWRPFYEIKPEHYINFANAFWFSKCYCIYAALPYMMENKYGKVVNISTDAGRTPTTGESMIGAGAAAIHQLTKVLAREVGRFGIRVNTIALGPVTDNTPRQEGAEIRQSEMGSKVGGRLRERLMFPVTSWDIAKTTLFLAAETGDNISGQIWSVNGGLSMPG